MRTQYQTYPPSGANNVVSDGGHPAKDIGNCTEMLRQLAMPWIKGEKIQAVIERVATAAGLTYWRAFNIYYRKSESISAEERSAIRAALDRKLLEDARDEFQRMRDQIDRLEQLYLSAQSHACGVGASADGVEDS